MINLLLNLKTFFLSLRTVTSTISPASGTGSYIEFTEQASLCCFLQPSIELKAGYFVFSDSTMREVYNNKSINFQLCTSSPLFQIGKRGSLNLYHAVEYFHRSGKSLDKHEKTCLWSVPVNIGLKPIYAINSNLQYYLAFGPRYLCIHQTNDSSYIDKNRSKTRLGFFVNTGFNYLLSNHLMFGVFGEYSYTKIKFKEKISTVYTRNTQVGGFTFGAGLGYQF